MRRWAHALALVAVACAPPTDADTVPASRTTSTAEVAHRALYGRVHALSDANEGLAGVTVEAAGVTAESDVAGGYWMEVPQPVPWLTVDAGARGYVPLLVHLPDHGEALEVWPGLATREEVDQILTLAAATSRISPTFDPTLAYLFVQIPHISDSSDTAGAELRVRVDGAPPEDVYVAAYNTALDTCIPRRVEDEVVTVDAACDGFMMLPELEDGATVRFEITHPTRECARSKEQRLEGLATPTLDFEIEAVAGWLNLTGAECEPVDKH
ncbi:MAG: hypothetical protein H6732_10075 [Alphaproteobacteria bacterium]|nr:hypothetical protein [Alphaproteobacteria bacterium]